MSFQYRTPKNQREIDEFKALRVRSFIEKGMTAGQNDNADEARGAEFFLLLDDKDRVLGGMRMVFQPFSEQHTMPTLRRLKLDLGEVFKGRGVDISGKLVADVSGIHMDRETVRKDPGVMMPLIAFAYEHAKEKGAELMVVSPTKPFDKVLMAVMKKHGVDYADLGDHDLVFPEKTEHKHVLVYSPDKELTKVKGRIM